MSDIAAGSPPSSRAPVVLPRETIRSMTDRVSGVPFRDGPWTWWWLCLIPCVGLLGLGVFSALWAFLHGIRVWGNDWPVMWGFPIINYVWWIAIASGGTFISAFFYLVRVEWRTSINRMAETMTLFGAACAGLYPIFHLGRPWFFYWLFPYPNTMDLWPQFKSPLFWDFMAIFTYVVSSVLFWYLGLVPDLATMRDRPGISRRAQVLYGFFALGFRGSGRQWRHFNAAYGVLAAIMAPLVVSVHSIVGLDFAGAGAVGWHSTEFPPFFVFGAMFSGFAMVLLIVLPLRQTLGLKPYITERHIEVMSRLMLVSSLCISYAYVMDAFNVFYGAEEAERRMFIERISGFDGWIYWATLVCNCILPLVLCFRRARLHQPTVILVSVSAVVGMWMERWGIVIMSLHRPRIPSAWGNYYPTFWDWSLFAGTVGLFFTGILITARLVPMVSMFEMRELLRGKH